MPKRKDIESILILGAGPIVIGQACEFDYSGAQACKALKEDGFKVILVNSNPATIMTDPSMADSTYIEPIHWETVEKIIEKEKPDDVILQPSELNGVIKDPDELEEFIERIRDARATGADVIKFQAHIASLETTPSEPWRVKFSRQDINRYDYWKRMEFSEEQWLDLKTHANETDLKFMSSPFSLEAVKLLRTSKEAVLSTISDKFKGYPFGSFVTFISGKDRSVVIYASNIAQHTINLKKDSKSSSES